MGLTCIKDHRPAQSLGNEDYLNGCAQCEVERLRAFASDVMTAWPIGDVDGSELQEYAVRRGLLTPVERTEPCGDGCSCAEYYATDDWPEGITCYRRPPWMRAA
jgi:hypothetical protein